MMEVMEDETVYDASISDAKLVVLTCHQPPLSRGAHRESSSLHDNRRVAHRL